MKKILSVAVGAVAVFGLQGAAPLSAAGPHGARFDAGAVPLDAAAVSWTTANSNSTGDQDVAAIAANRAGYVAVVWEDDRDTDNATDNVHSEIYLRTYRDGTALYEVKLSGGGSSGVTNWRHLTPDVGLDDKGNAVVVWADDPDGNGYYNIPYRVVSTSGSVTASGNANTSADGQQINPAVSVDPDGAPTIGNAVAFTVAWEDIQGTNPATIKAAGFTGPTTRAYEVTVSQTTGQHHRPDVATSASGDAVVVWDEDGDANGDYNVGLMRLARTDGAASLSRRVANASTGGQQRAAVVAANFNGDFAVAWESDHTGTAGVWTRSFNASGTARYADREVSSGTGASAPAIGLDDQANSVVGWSVQAADLDVWVSGLSPDGTDAGRLSAQRLSQVTAGRQEQMTVASSPFGEVSVAYTDDNDGNTYDQVILGVGITNSNW